ncbi:OLC1v1010654C1 [Oldenlandia corymbosa var. corymbosa]|uniref:OLC1v1010654C1 n=1 Tax=Oldenlandia corymbosa var. corymbosa TaxID=529605 RepID=A0AAV1DRU9_OLDCO|nr:OLC1v1010654C1 [Oldenlandia corymbosa var. corymbosa]
MAAGIDPETATELVKRGATLLLLDVPQYTLIGVDTQMFSTGPNFMGIKMVPPGIHFVYYSSSNREGSDFSPIVGFFVEAKPSQVIIRRWNQNEERFVKLSDEEEERYAEAVKRMEFDGKLGPYDLAAYGDWKRLSNYITKDTIDRIEPIGGEITVASEADIFGGNSKTTMEKALDEQLKGGKFSKKGESSQKKSCYYTKIPRVIKHTGIRGQELTGLNLDKTQLLENLLINEYGGVEDLLLAELQFAFIAFLMAQSLEAFLQWKSLVSLLFGCTEAPLHTRSQLFTKFNRVVYYQLKFGFQKDQQHNSVSQQGALPLLDESFLSADSFLHHLCKDFFSLVLEASVIDGDLLSWTRNLKQLLEDSLGWDFQEKSAVDGMFFEDDDEYAPVVVEMLDEPIHDGA